MEVDSQTGSRIEEEQLTGSGIRIQNWIAAVGAALILVLVAAS
jgi:hypothetical protein